LSSCATGGVSRRTQLHGVSQLEVSQESTASIFRFNEQTGITLFYVCLFVYLLGFLFNLKMGAMLAYEISVHSTKLYCVTSQSIMYFITVAMRTSDLIMRPAYWLEYKSRDLSLLLYIREDSYFIFYNYPLILDYTDPIEFRRCG
jgi:hypothetical protein